MEADISQLEAPTFTTINRGPPEPMLRLNWDHRVILIGEKVLNPMIHCCDKCLKPILIYGRMIPCKHVFCLACGKKEHKQCPRCLEKVSRVEQTGLGTVFMCSHGGTRYGQSGCRRTYLSQRDLQAHINHRHMTNVCVQQTAQQMQPQPVEVIIPDIDRNPPTRSKPSLANDPRSAIASCRRGPQIQTSNTRNSNLITVPIQETAPMVQEPIPVSTQNTNYYNQYQQPTNYNQNSMPVPSMLVSPPQPQQQYYAAPPAYSPAVSAQTYPPYSGSAAPQAAQPQYNTAPPPTSNVNVVPPRVTQPYDYSGVPQQWANSQQYYR